MIFDRVAEILFKGVDLNPVTDLRIQFFVDKEDGIQFNRGTIVIFNLPVKTRNILARPHPINRPLAEPVITVFLKAGYRGSETQIFAGDIISATNEREGPDWMTTIEVYSGYNVAQKSRGELSITSPTPAMTIIGKLLAPLKINITYTEAATEKLKNQMVAAYSASALSFRAGNEFLERYGLGFTLEDNDQGLVYVRNKARDPDAVKNIENTFSPETGLVGTPKITVLGINIRSLLRPRIRLLQRFFVDSDTVNATLVGGGGTTAGDYHVVKVSHAGDTRGENWHTEIEGVYTNQLPEIYNEI